MLQLVPRKTRLLAIALFSMMPGMASATILTGYATDLGSTVDVGDYVNGNVEYFIPLSDGLSGVYGVDDGGNYGQSADSSYAPLGDSTLDMYLYFNIAAGEVGTSLSLWFDDLDLAHSNDPTGFFETLRLYGADNGNPNSVRDGVLYDEWSDLTSLSNVSFAEAIPGDNNDVTLTISGLNLSGEFWLGMQFSSYSNGLSGRYRNTAEYLNGSVETSAVPEPELISLLGIGLLGLGLARFSRAGGFLRRRRFS